MSTDSLNFLWANQENATAPNIELPTTGNRERRINYTADEIKEKISHCRASWKHFFSKEDGKRQSKPFLCRIFHSEHGHCPHCLEQRILEIQKRISHATCEAGKANELVFYMDVNADERGSVSRDLGKGNFMACPLSNDKVRIFYQAEQPLNEMSEQLIAPTYEFWKQTSMSPVGKNLSGNLGKSSSLTAGGEKEEDSEKEVQINITEVVIVGLNRKEDESATREAYLETMDLDPKTPEEVEDALRKRTQAYIRAAVKRGGIVKYIEVVTQKLSATNINWVTGKDLVASELASGDVFSLVDF